MSAFYRNTGEESEDSCRETLVARFFEYQREAGCTYDAWHDDGHGIVGEECCRTFYISEIVEHVGIASVVDEYTEYVAVFSKNWRFA